MLLKQPRRLSLRWRPRVRAAGLLCLREVRFGSARTGVPHDALPARCMRRRPTSGSPFVCCGQQLGACRHSRFGAVVRLSSSQHAGQLAVRRVRERLYAVEIALSALHRRKRSGHFRLRAARVRACRLLPFVTGVGCRPGEHPAFLLCRRVPQHFGTRNESRIDSPFPVFSLLFQSHAKMTTKIVFGSGRSARL